MKDEKKVQTNEVAEATDNQPDVEATVEDKLQKILILPIKVWTFGRIRSRLTFSA